MSDPLTWASGYAGKKSLDWLVGAAGKEDLHKRLRNAVSDWSSAQVDPAYPIPSFEKASKLLG